MSAASRSIPAVRLCKVRWLSTSLLLSGRQPPGYVVVDRRLLRVPTRLRGERGHHRVDVEDELHERREQLPGAVQHTPDPASARRPVDAVALEGERLRRRQRDRGALAFRLPRAAPSRGGFALRMRARICAMIRSTSIWSGCAGSSDIYHPGGAACRRAAAGRRPVRDRAVIAIGRSIRAMAGACLPYRRRRRLSIIERAGSRAGRRGRRPRATARERRGAEQRWWRMRVFDSFPVSSTNRQLGACLEDSRERRAAKAA